MTIVTKVSTASFDDRSTVMAGYISGLVAGEALVAVEPCRIDGDGKVYGCATGEAQRLSGSATYVMTDFAGFAAVAYNSGDPVTLFRASAIASYSSAGLTPGGYLYSGSVAGTLSTTAVIAADKPLALAISDSDIMVIGV